MAEPSREEEGFRRALELDPDDGGALAAYSDWLQERGRDPADARRFLAGSDRHTGIFTCTVTVAAYTLDCPDSRARALKYTRLQLLDWSSRLLARVTRDGRDYCVRQRVSEAPRRSPYDLGPESSLGVTRTVLVCLGRAEDAAVGEVVHADGVLGVSGRDRLVPVPRGGRAEQVEQWHFRRVRFRDGADEGFWWERVS